MDGNLVQADEALGLGQVLGNEEGVEVFQVGKADKLGSIGLVADVALLAGV